MDIWPGSPVWGAVAGGGDFQLGDGVVMEKDTQDELDLLLGRIVAIEELMVGFIAAQADVYQGSQEDVLAGWLKSIKQGSQYAQRAVGERPDAVWEAAVQSLEALFARAALRHSSRERS